MLQVLKAVKKWVWIIIAVLLFLSVGFLAAVLSSDQSSGGKTVGVVLGLIPLMIAGALFVYAFKAAQKSLEQDKTSREHAKMKETQRQAEYEQEQYTFSGSQKAGNYEIFYFAPKDHASQRWLYSLNVGDELYVIRDVLSDTHNYTVGPDVPLTPRLEHFYESKRICRLYVYSINDADPESRYIEILAAYNA